MVQVIGTPVNGTNNTPSGFNPNKPYRVDPNDVPIAVLGIIATKVTAENGKIEVGDLLVTASTPGHAMKAKQIRINGVDIYPTGAILGKALQSLGEERGVIKVLIMLR